MKCFTVKAILLYLLLLTSCNKFCLDAPPDKPLSNCIETLIPYQENENYSFKNINNEVIYFTVTERLVTEDDYGSEDYCSTTNIEDLSCKLEGNNSEFMHFKTVTQNNFSLQISFPNHSEFHRPGIESASCNFKNVKNIDTVELANQLIFNVYRRDTGFDTFSNVFFNQVSNKIAGFTLDSVEWVLIQ